MKIKIINLDVYPRDLAVHREYVKFCQENPGYCPFTDRRTIQKEFLNWCIKKNDYPYKDATDHLLLFPKRRVQYLTELTEDELLELPQIIELYRVKNYKTVFSGIAESSIPGYLHFHLIQSEKESPIKMG